MMANDNPNADTMTAKLANFLELLTVSRMEIKASGERPTEIPDELRAALLELLST